MDDMDEASLEVYSANQDQISKILKSEYKYKFLAELASKYGELAHEINNRADLEKLVDPGSIAIAVQILVSSFTLIENDFERLLTYAEGLRLAKRNIEAEKMTPTHAYKINALMVKHGFSPLGIGEMNYGDRLYAFIEWLSNMVGDRKKDEK